MNLRESFIDVPQARVRVLERGGDPENTVFFLHGIGSSASSWQPHLERLEQGIRGIGFDWLGCGYTERRGRRAPITRSDQRELLLAVAEASGAESFRVVAHSMGCGPALGVAWRHPNMVRAMLLESPATQGRRVRGPAIWMAMHRPAARLMEAAAPLLVRIVARAKANQLAGGTPDPEFTRRELGHAIDRPREAMRGYVDIIGAVDVRRASPESEHYREIRVPVWIVRGVDDRDWMPESHEARYRELLGEARLIRLQGVGHSPHIEAPDLFAEALASFLAATAQKKRATRGREGAARADERGIS